MSKTCPACFTHFASHLSQSRHARTCALLRTQSEANRKILKDSEATRNRSAAIGRGAERRLAQAARRRVWEDLDPLPEPPPKKKARKNPRPLRRNAAVAINDVLPEGPILPSEDIIAFQEPSEVDQGAPAEPSEAGTVFNIDTDAYEDDEPQPQAIDASPEPRGFSTLANVFGLWRTYLKKPACVPDAEGRGDTVERSEDETAAIVSDIIAPYPNLSAFWYGYLASTTTRWSNYMRDIIPKMFGSPKFIMSDFQGCNYEQMERLTCESSSSPWGEANRGWRETSIPLSIPEFAKKKLPISKKRKASDSHESANSSAIHAVPGFHHRPIMSVLKSVLTSPDSKNFHYEPYDHWWSRPGSDDPPIRVHGESYTSASWVEEHQKVQELVLPPEDTDELPRAIAALMFWSDATHLAQFGTASVWPIYMAFGNQSKYERSKPGSHALHHLAYMPCLQKSIEDYLATVTGAKRTSPGLLAHCRRELFQGGWYEILGDEEFLKAYVSGVVIKCSDGITRRIFPRIFCYSADYPEKAKVATIRDNGTFPCTRCLIAKQDIPSLGMVSDMRFRLRNARKDDQEFRDKVDKAYALIYKDKRPFASADVDDLLKGQSLVPSKNAFSRALSPFGFDFFKILRVDLLHEVELGLFKNVFSHLIRILHSRGDEYIRIVNQRYVLVPSFGSSGSAIRHFVSNVSEMKNLAARDYEDLIQCAIPCFEGLFLEADNNRISALLYTMLTWHGLAKLCLHTDLTITLLRNATTQLGRDLRFFAKNICPHYETVDTPREAEARARDAARKKKPPAKGPVRHTFNMSTWKIHALGYYVEDIIEYGTTDGFSTQLGEHEHRRLKGRYRISSKRNATAQLVKRCFFETALRFKALLLNKYGVLPPVRLRDLEPLSAEASVDEEDLLQSRYVLSKVAAQRHCIPDWLNDNEPACERFVERLKNHCLGRIQELDVAEEDLQFSDKERAELIINHNYLHEHATIKFNFTTYDVKRECDVVKPYSTTNDKCDIMLPSREDDSSHPFWYARVIGVFHVDVTHKPTQQSKRRIDFLWVRWFGQDTQWRGGRSARKLDRIGFVPHGGVDEPFGFVDPNTVIRGCHLIPTFHCGRTYNLLPASKYRGRSGDYVNYYVNPFVTRDMLMRYNGLGVGHVDSRTRASPCLAVERAQDDHELSDVERAQEDHELSDVDENLVVAQDGSECDSDDWDEDEEDVEDDIFELAADAHADF